MVSRQLLIYFLKLHLTALVQRAQLILRFTINDPE